MAGGALASLALGRAGRAQTLPGLTGDERVRARPKRVATTARGTSPLGLGAERDAILQVPATVPDAPLPLVVLLHGAGGRADRLLTRFASASEAAGVAVLAVDSRGQTWDAIRGRFGPDVAFIDRALTRVFETVSVDPKRLAIGGFSDGASYALALGLINGDAFRKIAAFSPGFLMDVPPEGRPRLFVSHGTKDDVLPIERSSRSIVPTLRRNGYIVTFREFEGGHEVPPAIADEGLKWISG